MKRHTLRRAMWSGAGAWLAWLLASAIGLPSLAAFMAASAVLALSHWLSPSLILASAGASDKPVLPNDPDPARCGLFHRCVEVAVEEGVAPPRVYVGDEHMRHWIIAAASTRFNPTVCVHPTLLQDDWSEVLNAGLRNELWAVRMNLPVHGTVWVCCMALTLAWMGPAVI